MVTHLAHFVEALLVSSFSVLTIRSQEAIQLTKVGLRDSSLQLWALLITAARGESCQSLAIPNHCSQ